MAIKAPDGANNVGIRLKWESVQRRIMANSKFSSKLVTGGV